MKKLIFASFVILLTAVSNAHEGDVVRLGDKAPPIKETPLAKDNLPGKVVLLSFFSLQSVPSMRELDFIERDICIPNRTAALATIAIGRDHEGPQLADLNTAKYLGIHFIADPKRKIYNLYATEDIPRCYVIGKDGLIKYSSVGFDEWEIDRIKAAVDLALQK
jgi:hypothetical protein